MLRGNSNTPAAPIVLDGITGRWINDPTNGGSQSGAAVTVADTLYVHAYTLPFNCRVLTLATRVTVVGVSSNVKNALYRKRAGSTVCDLITDVNPTGISTTSTGTKDCNITDIDLAAGTYVAASLVDGSTGATFTGFASASLITVKNGGYTSSANLFSSALYGYSQAQTYASGFPATIDLASMTQVTTNIVPHVAVGI